MADISFTDNLIIKWNGNDYNVKSLLVTSTVSDLKKAIFDQTNVLPERQKLLGLKYNGKIATDGNLISELQLKSTTKIMMMGTPEEIIAKALELPSTDLPEVINDLDIGEEEEVKVENQIEYIAKIEKRIKTYEFKILNEPRPDKKLLVLDVDYTLFDHRSAAESGLELTRPYLHDFLASAYVHYDIVIWSATSMKWIEIKMQEMGVSRATNYKICFLVDSLAMITVDVPDYGVIEVKPLGLIWGRFPQWNKCNTIMFDDLRRNFLMNPQNGLKIRPFKNAHFTRNSDKELKRLSKYLLSISNLDDLSTLNHRSWERYYKDCRNSDKKKSRHKKKKMDSHGEDCS